MQAYEGDWILTRRKGDKIVCCDCGLVHRVKYKVATDGRAIKILWQMSRDERATSAIRRCSGRRSLRSDVGDPRLLRDCLPRTLAALADPLKDQWSRAVFDALRFPFPADSLPGRQELGAYESLYEGLMRDPRLTDAAKIEILAHDLKTAAKKGREKRNRRKGAVWTKIHQDRVKQYLARARPPPV